MCQREGTSLQRGMNFRLRGGHSVILMSLRPGAPYRDELAENGTVLRYEGHDAPRTGSTQDPKQVDQPGTFPSGAPTQNGKFFAAATATERGVAAPERVRVYEKLRDGVWVYNGLFHLVGATVEHDGRRRVFVFRLHLADQGDTGDLSARAVEPRRIIPTHVKVEVYKRDGGRCVVCGSATDLHFDHVLPYSRGGSSNTAANVQLLCAGHNLAKSDHLI